jgi:hypothetical protein
MKKTMIAALLATAAGVCHAGGWENYEARASSCELYGKTGDLYYRMALQGKKPTGHDPAWSEPMRQHIEDVIYANPTAYDRDSAARWAFSYCMDNWLAMVHQAQRDGTLPQ